MEETKVKRGRPKVVVNLSIDELKDIIREVLKEEFTQIIKKEMDIVEGRLYHGLLSQLRRNGVIK